MSSNVNNLFRDQYEKVHLILGPMYNPNKENFGLKNWDFIVNVFKESFNITNPNQFYDHGERKFQLALQSPDSDLRKRQFLLARIWYKMAADENHAGAIEKLKKLQVTETLEPYETARDLSKLDILALAADQALKQLSQNTNGSLKRKRSS